jgi:hypothetical protein
VHPLGLAATFGAGATSDRAGEVRSSSLLGAPRLRGSARAPRPRHRSAQGGRERHRYPDEPALTRGDRVAAWLAGALLERSTRRYRPSTCPGPGTRTAPPTGDDAVRPPRAASQPPRRPVGSRCPPRTGHREWLRLADGPRRTDDLRAPRGRGARAAARPRGAGRVAPRFPTRAGTPARHVSLRATHGSLHLDWRTAANTTCWVRRDPDGALHAMRELPFPTIAFGVVAEQPVFVAAQRGTAVCGGRDPVCRPIGRARTRNRRGRDGWPEQRIARRLRHVRHRRSRPGGSDHPAPAPRLRPREFLGSRRWPLRKPVGDAHGGPSTRPAYRARLRAVGPAAAHRLSSPLRAHARRPKNLRRRCRARRRSVQRRHLSTSVPAGCRLACGPGAYAGRSAIALLRFDPNRTNPPRFRPVGSFGAVGAACSAEMTTRPRYDPRIRDAVARTGARTFLGRLASLEPEAETNATVYGGHQPGSSTTDSAPRRRSFPARRPWIARGAGEVVTLDVRDTELVRERLAARAGGGAGARAGGAAAASPRVGRSRPPCSSWSCWVGFGAAAQPHSRRARPVRSSTRAAQAGALARAGRPERRVARAPAPADG